MMFKRNKAEPNMIGDSTSLMQLVPKGIMGDRRGSVPHTAT